ncbi:hypothetical protein DFJ73DRAFT_39686 [Zopfochytrium polystomum]|nr:hypothetical protein DFJ73DRAFT_39686 [Zopfochytrium polystomum]
MAAMAEKLEVSLRLINALKQENETFKDSIQQMKESQANQSAHIESLEQQREAIQQENLSLHKQLSELTAACKTQVDSKNAEIQKLKAAPLSKAELDVLRLQFQTEAEKKYAVRVGQHASEVEGLKSLVFKLRRENELLREDNARQSRNFAADLKKAKKAHVEEIASFEERVKELQSCIDSLSDTDRVRQLQRQNADLHLKIQGLTEELEEQRCRRESLRVEMEQKERLSQRRLIEEGAALKCATMERDSFAAKSQALQEELRQKARLQDELSEENARLKKEVLRAQSQAEEVAHRSTSVKANEIKAAVLKKRADGRRLVVRAEKND